MYLMRTSTKICNRNLHVWRADNTRYVWENSCFMILDLFSYVTFKKGEPRSASVICSSFTECWRCNKSKILLDFFMEECYNWLSSCDTLAWAQQFSRQLSFFWVRPQDSVKTTLGWHLTRLRVLVWLCRKKIASAFICVWLMKGIFTLNPSGRKIFCRLHFPDRAYLIP